MSWREDHVEGLVQFEAVGTEHEGFEQQAVRIDAYGRRRTGEDNLANVSAQGILRVVVVRAYLDVLGTNGEVDGFIQRREIVVFDRQMQRVSAFERLELAVIRLARAQTHRFDQVVAAEKTRH